MNNHYCGVCDYFQTTDFKNLKGVCRKLGTNALPDDNKTCPFFSNMRVTVRPRRLCDFCERHKLIDDEYARYKIGCMKLIPLPSINLTTGEKSDPKRNVEYSMFVYESDADNGEVGSFPIKFCPYCGRKLGGEKDG